MPGVDSAGKSAGSVAKVLPSPEAFSAGIAVRRGGGSGAFRFPPEARAAQVVSRLDRTGRGDLVDAVAAGGSAGARLLALVAELVRERDDPDAALRAAVGDVIDAAR